MVRYFVYAIAALGAFELTLERTSNVAEARGRCCRRARVHCGTYSRGNWGYGGSAYQNQAVCQTAGYSTMGNTGVNTYQGNYSASPNPGYAPNPDATRDVPAPPAPAVGDTDDSTSPNRVNRDRTSERGATGSPRDNAPPVPEATRSNDTTSSSR